MQREIPANVIGACFGLSAFAIALLGGLAAGQPAASILSAATVSMLVCYVLGLIIARVADVAVREVAAPDSRTSGASATTSAPHDHAVQEAA